jgi:hypothetical protein
MRMISGRFSAVAALLCALLGVTAWGTDSRKQATASGVSSLPADAQASISAALGRDLLDYHVRMKHGALATENARQRLKAEFSDRGVSIETGNTHWAMSLLGYGHGDALTAATDTAPHAIANRVEYRRGPITEWYVNGPLGLEQGFTISKRPGNGKGQPLTIALTLSGDLTPSVDGDGKGLALAGGRGGASLVYTGLTARDADGKDLHAWLEVRGKQLLLRAGEAGARYPVAIDPLVQLAQLTASFGTVGDSVGYSVAISGNTVVVGAPFEAAELGAGYVFVKPASGWANMTQTAKLTASDGASGDLLGLSVAISGNAVVVGAPNAYGAGSAYVYVRPAQGWTNITETAKLTPSNPAFQYGSLGWSVSISGDTIVAGVPDAQPVSGNSSEGGGCVFVKPAGGWVSMTETADLSALHPQNNDYLGQSVAISGNTVVAGMPGWNGGGSAGQGAAYVFVRPANGWVSMTETAELLASDGRLYDQLGTSVAINGNIAVAGAPLATIGFNEYQGAVYVFTAPAGGWTDEYQTAKLTASDGLPGDELGYSVSLDGKDLVAGAPNVFIGSKAYQGAAYAFREPANGWVNGTQTTEFTESRGLAYDGFGSAVSGSGGTAAVGTPGGVLGGPGVIGRAYVFGP